MNIDVADRTYENFIGFDAYNLKSAQVIWANYDLYADKLGSVENLNKSMIDENAYLIKETSCFSSLSFNFSDKKVLYAERYGGEGISVNGGGGRCGNTEQFQLKGIGANCTVGAHDDIMHGYGGLDAPLAIIETIYTNLFNRLLPLGAVKIHALIYTGKKTAIYHHPANKCWGVIMVRDQCIRPAHYMRATHFKPQQQYKHLLIDDVARIRKINKDLLSHFKEPNQFILFLGKFLKNSANQFGFARAMRIMHGTITPSNMTIEGQWLDLPVASMLSGGINQCITSHFYTEHQAPIRYAIELLHGFGKYNGLLLNPTPLINYYNEQFDAYFRHYIGYVLGLDLALTEKHNKESWLTITNAFNTVIHSGKFLVISPIVANDNDPVHALINALLLSAVSSDVAASYFDLAKIEESQRTALKESFSVVIQSVWQEAKMTTNADFSFTNFIVSTALIALKRAYLASVFFCTRISDTTWDLCQHKSPEDASDFINDYDSIAEWVYTTETDKIIIYKSKTQEIAYSQNNGTYRISTSDNELTVKTYAELLNEINKSNSESYIINDFSFTNYLKKLSTTITLIENEIN